MKNRPVKDTSRALRLCADFLDRLSNEEFDNFLQGNIQLVLADTSAQSTERFTSGQHPDPERFAPRRSPERSTGNNSRARIDSSADMRPLIDALQASKTRDEVLRILQRDARVDSREKLAQFAKTLRVHVNKSDRREMLEDKIAESVIGVRLRSEAIQGVNLKAAPREND